MSFEAIWMELETLILSEVSQKEKDKYHMISHMWNPKYSTNKPIYKSETDSQTYSTNLWLQGVGIGMDWEFGISRCKLLNLEWISRSSHRGSVVNESD